MGRNSLCTADSTGERNRYEALRCKKKGKKGPSVFISKPLLITVIKFKRETLAGQMSHDNTLFLFPQFNSSAEGKG